MRRVTEGDGLGYNVHREEGRNLKLRRRRICAFDCLLAAVSSGVVLITMLHCVIVLAAGNYSRPAAVKSKRS